MTFTQLNYFITIAQNLSFSKASELLFVTQSTLSRSMASLESELEVTLFDRAYHNLKLTPAGEVLFRDGAKLMDSMNAVISRMQVLEQNQKNRLTIGILDGQKVENSVLRIVREVMELIPEFSIDIKRMDYDTAIRSLSESRLDIVQTLSPNDVIPGEGIMQRIIEEEGYYLIACTDDPFWTEWDGSISILQDKVLLMPNAYPGNGQVLQRLSDKGVLPRMKIAPDVETLSLWLEAGMGVTICNASHVVSNSNIKRPIRVELLPELPTIPMTLLWNTSNMTPLLERFLSFL